MTKAKTLALLLTLAFFTMPELSAAEKPATWKDLHGVWIGRPVVKKTESSSPDTSGGLLTAQRDAAQRLADTIRLKFDFQSRKDLTMTLSQAGRDDNTQRGQWKVIESDINTLLIEITVESKDKTKVRRLDITFNNKSKFTATEVKGDPRVPPLLFTRPGKK